jgi:hypothetical protein
MRSFLTSLASPLNINSLNFAPTPFFLIFGAVVVIGLIASFSTGFSSAFFAY